MVQVWAESYERQLYRALAELFIMFITVHNGQMTLAAQLFTPLRG
jgi:hypothetical protein